MRVHFLGSTMTYRQADTLLYYLENKSEVISAKVYERTGDAVIRYKGERRRILEMLRSFCYDKVVVPNERSKKLRRKLVLMMKRRENSNCREQDGINRENTCGFLAKRRTGSAGVSF